MYHPFPEDRSKAILRAQEYVRLDPLFLDTETTGLGPMDEICETAIVDQAGNVLINSLVKPTKLIPSGASDIHGITNDMVQNAPTFRDLLPELESILRDRTVLVYNMEFDVDKLTRSFQANNFQLGQGWFEPWWSLVEVGTGLVSDWHCAMELYAAYYGGWDDYHHSYRWQRLSAALLQCKLEMPTGIIVRMQTLK